MKNTKLLIEKIKELPIITIDGRKCKVTDAEVYFDDYLVELTFEDGSPIYHNEIPGYACMNMGYNGKANSPFRARDPSECCGFHPMERGKE